MSGDQSKPEALEILQMRAIAFCDKVKALESVLEVDEAEGVSLSEGEPPAEEGPRSAVTADESLARLLAGERRRASFKGMEWCGPAQRLSLKVLFYANQLLSLGDAVMTPIRRGYGIYDDDDGDDVIVSLTSATWAVELGQDACSTPRLVAVPVDLPGAPRLLSVAVRRAFLGRAPPRV